MFRNKDISRFLLPTKIAAYLIEKIGSTASGYFHLSLWLSESHDLLVAQRFHGIELRGLDGGPNSKNQPNGNADDDSGHGRPHGNAARPFQADPDEQHEPIHQNQRQHAADSSERHGLQQKLPGDVAPFCWRPWRSLES